MCRGAELGQCLEETPERLRRQKPLRPHGLRPASYNNRADMIVCCPTTTRIKGCPFEVARRTPPSIVLADQVKSKDWRARKVNRKE